MSELFPAFSGDKLVVSDSTHAYMLRHFPHLDLQGFYRAMDSHLEICPKSRCPRKIRSFLIRNAKRETACTLRNAAAWQERESAIRQETRAGSNHHDTSV